MSTGSASSFNQEDLKRYVNASSVLKDARSELQALQETEAVGTFNKQMALLERRLLNNPGVFREMFITDGMNAVVGEF